jgi:uncharacterized membrane protein
MSRLLKFLHTMGAIGMMGALAALVVMQLFSPPVDALSNYAALRGVMSAVAQWLFMPSLGVTLVAGLLAIAANRGFHNAGWAWIKAATGVLLFESGFIGVVGPMQREAENSLKALAGQFDAKKLGTEISAETTTLWILLAISVANVILGVWRPRLLRLKNRG